MDRQDQRARGRFTTAVTLSPELLAAADDHRRPRCLKIWTSSALVIVGDLGYCAARTRCTADVPVGRALRGRLGAGDHEPGVQPLDRGVGRRDAHRRTARSPHALPTAFDHRLGLRAGLLRESSSQTAAMMTVFICALPEPHDLLKSAPEAPPSTQAWGELRLGALPCMSHVPKGLPNAPRSGTTPHRVH